MYTNACTILEPTACASHLLFSSPGTHRRSEQLTIPSRLSCLQHLGGFSAFPCPSRVLPIFSLCPPMTLSMSFQCPLTNPFHVRSQMSHVLTVSSSCRTHVPPMSLPCPSDVVRGAHMSLISVRRQALFMFTYTSSEPLAR